MNHKDSFSTKSPDVHLETNGLVFIEICAHSLDQVLGPLQDIGFALSGRHRSKDIFLLKGGETTLLVNCEAHSHASALHHYHGVSVSAIGIVAKNTQALLQKALDHGATPHHEPLGPMEINLPSLRLPTDQLVYLIEDRRDINIFDINYQAASKTKQHVATNFGPIGCLYFFLDGVKQESLIRFLSALFHFDVTRDGTRTILTSGCKKIHIALEETQEDSTLSSLVGHHWHQGLCGIELSLPDTSTDAPPLKKWRETQETLFHPLSPKALAKGRGDHSALTSYVTQRTVGPVFFFTTHVKKNQKKTA